MHYCVANLFKIPCTKFYQNWMGFVEDMTKTFRLIFSESQCSCEIDSVRLEV